MSNTLIKLWYNLVKFFYKQEHFDQFVAIKHRRLQNEQGVKISLRMIEFLLTTYCIQHPVSYALVKLPKGNQFVDFDDPDFELKKKDFAAQKGELEMFELRSEYQKQIDTYHKKLFDPCCRAKPHERISFKGPHDFEVTTTLKQLVFFYWAIQHCVIDWLMKHAKEVKESMKYEEAEKKKAKEVGMKREAEDPTYKFRSRFETLKRKKGNKLMTESMVNVIYKNDTETWD